MKDAHKRLNMSKSGFSFEKPAFSGLMELFQRDIPVPNTADGPKGPTKIRQSSV